MMRTPSASTHPLDHLVLPTQSVDLARRRLTSLGFTVAPTGIHPFGTENCCVFLADGTYLEPLAVADQQVAIQAVADGNVFVARDRLYRDAVGDEGFSGVVLGTADADADHARFVEAGLSAGETLSFSRAFTDVAGNSAVASFKLAFASGRGATDAFLFACERVNAPKVDRSVLQIHANDATGIVEIVAVSDRPVDQDRLISVAVNDCVHEAQGGVYRLPNAGLTILDPASFAARYGLPCGPPTALRFAAVVFSVGRAEATSRLLAGNDIEHDISGGDIVVRPSPGQGAAFIFRETQ